MALGKTARLLGVSTLGLVVAVGHNDWTYGLMLRGVIKLSKRDREASLDTPFSGPDASKTTL